MIFKCQRFLTFIQVPGVKSGNRLHCRKQRLRGCGCVSAPWVFNNDNGSADNCADNCANNCANNLHNDDTNNRVFRGAMFGSLGAPWGKTVLPTCGTKCANTFQMWISASVSNLCLV